jgi:hypothetical protein
LDDSDQVAIAFQLPFATAYLGAAKAVAGRRIQVLTMIMTNDNISLLPAKFKCWAAT